MNPLLKYITEANWALEPTIAQKMAEVLSAHFSGEKSDAGIVAEVVEERRRRIRERAERDGVALGEPGNEDTAREPTRHGTVCVVPVDGFLTPYASMINGMSQPGGTTVAQLEEWIAAAAADPSVRCILLDIDSPGGTAAGMDDLAKAVKAADAVKPVYAFAHDQATSAAYLMGSQARSFYTSTMGVLGSIGVMVMLRDTSAAESGKGVKLHLVRSAPFKGAGAPGAPVSESDLASVQERVDQLHAAFVKMVAEGRGIALDKAAALADGKSHVGAAAVKLGLADGVIGFRELVARLNDVHGGTNGNNAAGRRPVMSTGGITMKLDDLKVQHPALLAEYRELVAAEMRSTITAEVTAAHAPKPATIAQLKAEFPGAASAEFRESCAEKGMTLEAAKAAYAGEVKAQLTAVTTERDQLKTKVAELQSLGEAGRGTSAVGAGPGAGGGGGGGGTFEQAVLALAQKDGIPVPQACHKLAHSPEHRAAYEDWKSRKCPVIKSAAA